MHYIAKVEDRTIFFELTAAQTFGEGKQTVPIHWQDKGEVFVGELELTDILALDIQPEPSPIQE